MNSKFKKYSSNSGKLHWAVVLCMAVVTLLPTMLLAQGELTKDNYPKISGSLSPDSIGIGDRFTYSIEIEKDIAQSIFFPMIGGEDTYYELIGTPVVDTLSREGRKLRVRQTYCLAAFQEGRHHVVPQAIYADKNIIDTLKGDDTLTLLVTTFQIDSTSHSIFDIKPQKDMPFKFAEISGYVKWTIIALVVLALLAYVAYRIMRHYGKSFSDIFHTAPPLPPHEVARQALERLYVQRLWQADKHKLYYSTITDILRTYIDGRFGIGAMEMTTAEIFDRMKGTDVPEKLQKEAKELFDRADFVKFAKYVASEDENAATLPLAVRFVTETYQAEIVAEEEKEEGGAE